MGDDKEEPDQSKNGDNITPGVIVRNTFRNASDADFRYADTISGCCDHSTADTVIPRSLTFTLSTVTLYLTRIKNHVDILPVSINVCDQQ